MYKARTEFKYNVKQKVSRQLWVRVQSSSFKPKDTVVLHTSGAQRKGLWQCCALRPGQLRVRVQGLEFRFTPEDTVVLHRSRASCCCPRRSWASRLVGSTPCCWRSPAASGPPAATAAASWAWARPRRKPRCDRTASPRSQVSLEWLHMFALAVKRCKAGHGRSQSQGIVIPGFNAKV